MGSRKIVLMDLLQGSNGDAERTGLWTLWVKEGERRMERVSIET